MFTTFFETMVFRYRSQLSGLSWLLKVGILGICGQLGTGLTLDSWPNRALEAASLFMTGVMLILAIEVASLLEFRGVQLFDYSSAKTSPERDAVLGRFVLRALLVLGNIALAISLYKDFLHK